MATLQTADGRLLKSQRPAGANLGAGRLRNMGGHPFEFRIGDSDDDLHLRSYESLYRSQPVLAGVIDKLTRRVSTLPFDAYRRLPDDSREVVRGDTLDSLIRRPMPRRATVHLNAHVMQSMLIHGNALVAKLRGPEEDQPPVMLWPLNWADMSAYGQPGGTIEWWSTRQFDNVERFIAAEDVIHFAWPGTDGGEIGVSPLEKLGVTIRQEDAAQRHSIGLMKNGVRPSLAVSVDDPNIKADGLEFVRARVEAMHKGADNAGRTFFMGPNVKLQPLSLSPVEVALIEQRKLGLQEVGMVFDMAGPLMGDLEHGTYSNVEELLRSLYRDVAPPWLALIEGTYQAQLVEPEAAWFERSLAFDLTDKLKGDPVELANSLKIQVEAGLITRNEARRILNMPPDGDPADPTNPANQLSANVNNQAPLAAMDSGDPVPAPIASPASQE